MVDSIIGISCAMCFRCRWRLEATIVELTMISACSNACYSLLFEIPKFND